MKISRRDFLKYCASSATLLGLEASIIGKLQKALAGNGPTVIWLAGAACTGCSVSLANRIAPSAPVDVADLLINHINLAFHPNLMSAAGDLAVQNLRSAAAGNFVLAVEGCIPGAFGGAACNLMYEGGRDVTALEAVRDLGNRSIANLAIGTCASYGGICSASPNPTQGTSLQTAIGKPTINIPGCPTHPDWIVWTIAQLIAGVIPTLDSSNRPSALFGRTVHDRCPRREGMGEVDRYGVVGCLKELSCKGPETRGDCPVRRWNNGTSFCVDANSLCLGCTESGFPDRFSPFHRVTTTTTAAPLLFGITNAEYQSAARQVRVEGSGKAGTAVSLAAYEGSSLGTGTIDSAGRWLVTLNNPATVPAKVVAENQGIALSANVRNAPVVTDPPLAVSVAEFRSATGQLRVTGTGKPSVPVTIRASGGALLGSVTIDAAGAWVFTLSNPSPVPAQIIAESNGESVTRTVTTISGTPGGTLAISSAEWRADVRELRVDGTGTPAAYVQVKSSTGTLLGTVRVDAEGKWRLRKTGLVIVPTVVTATSNGTTVSAPVQNAPAGTIALAITRAQWDRSSRQLRVEGKGSAGASVAVYNVASGAKLGTYLVSSDGKWRMTKATSYISRVRAESNGQRVERAVTSVD